MLRRKIREESLRTYLFTYSNVYDSVSIPRLAEMYEMEVRHLNCNMRHLLYENDARKLGMYA